MRWHGAEWGALNADDFFAIDADCSFPSVYGAMSVFIDRAQGPNTIHILIVGVGKPKAFEALRGMGATVRRLFEWYRDQGDAYWLEGRKPGTIEVLASAEDDLSLETDDGVATPDLPTFDNVKRSMRGWIDRTAAGGRGLLHWAGHGATVGVDAFKADAVFLDDLVEDSNVPHFFKYPTLKEALTFTGDGARISCFIDACRTDYRPVSGCSGVFPPRDATVEKSSVFVEWSTVPGGTAESYAVPIPATDFGGGPLYSNALLDSIKFYAAKPAPGGRMISTLGSIADGLDLRLLRLAGHIPELDDAWKPAIPLLEIPTWYREDFCLMESPESMVNVTLPNGVPHDGYSCVAKCATTGTLLEAAQGPKYFEMSVPYRRHEIEASEIGKEQSGKFCGSVEPHGNLTFVEDLAHRTEDSR